MKRLFITLGLTLLIALAYFSQANADAPATITKREQAPVKDNGTVKKKAKDITANKKKSAVPDALRADDKDKSADTSTDKSSVSTKINQTFTDKTDNGIDVESNVSQSDSGDYTVTAHVVGCKECEATVTKKKDDLDIHKSVLDQLVDVKNALVGAHFGKVVTQAKKEETPEEKKERLKEEREAKAEEKKQKADIEACNIDKDDLHRLNPADKVSCLTDKVDALFKSGKDKDIAKAQELLDQMGLQAAKDIANGNYNSPYVKYMKGILAQTKPANDSDYDYIAKFNAAQAAMTFGTKAAYLSYQGQVTTLKQSADNNRNLAIKTTTLAEKTRLLALANQQSTQAAQISRNLPALEETAKVEITKFRALNVSVKGFDKQDFIDRYSALPGTSSTFYSDVLVGDGLTSTSVSTGNTAADSAGGVSKTDKNLGVDYNTNLEAIKERISRQYNKWDCRDLGNASGQSCGGTPNNIPAAPPFAGNGSTAMPAAANLQQQNQQTNNAATNRQNFSYANRSGR